MGEVFRSLVSLTKNNDMTAMMPLLAAGDQVGLLSIYHNIVLKGVMSPT